MMASIFGLITFILGCFAGFAVYHYFFRLSNQEKRLENELIHMKHDLKQYQEQIAKHLTESALLANYLKENACKLHDHILNASVALNRNQEKQSILQPVLHLQGIDEEQDDEQVTEFHPTQIKKKTMPVTPPKDYV